MRDKTDKNETEETPYRIHIQVGRGGENPKPPLIAKRRQRKAEIRKGTTNNIQNLVTT